VGSTYSNDGGNSTPAMLVKRLSSRFRSLWGKDIASRTKHALVGRETHVSQDARALARAPSPRPHSLGAAVVEGTRRDQGDALVI